MQTNRFTTRGMLVLAGMLSILGSAAAALAAPYTVSLIDPSAAWNTVYAQGFNTQLTANPDPGLSAGTPVYLDQFQFYKSGNADSASNIQLAIFNTMYPNTVGLTTSSSSFVGLSTNTIASTASLNTGDPETFNFNSLPLSYGNDYSAVFVNVDGSGNITPVLVSALQVHYVDDGTGTFHPAINYGTESQFQYTTSNFINNGFFSAFSFAGDVNFTASLDTTAVPEPSALLLGIGGISLLGLTRRRRLGGFKELS